MGEEELRRKRKKQRKIMLKRNKYHIVYIPIPTYVLKGGERMVK